MLTPFPNKFCVGESSMSVANNQIIALSQLPAAYQPVHGIGYSTADIVTEDVPFQPSSKTVLYVDAECGRGKTYMDLPR
jgi:hypothetical protein